MPSLPLRGYTPQSSSASLLPSLSEQDKQNFYHFTSLYYLPSIMKAGLNRGQIPIGFYKFLNGPSLTRDPDPHHLWWNRDQSGRIRTRVRLTALMDRSDPDLRRWRDVCKEHRVRRKVIKFYDPYGDSHNWYVYFGVITREAISVELRNNSDGVYRRIEGDELVDTLQNVEAEIERAIQFVPIPKSSERGVPQFVATLKEGVESSWLFE